MKLGIFTSTPVNPPKWAFDIQYLSFVQQQFLAGVPNFSAWCNATVAFLKKEGCEDVPSAVSKIPMIKIQWGRHSIALLGSSLSPFILITATLPAGPGPGQQFAGRSHLRHSSPGSLSFSTPLAQCAGRDFPAEC